MGYIMSKREDKYITLLNEFKEEQNIKMNELKKKNKRAILFVMFVCLFVSGITSVLSYTLGASSVEYTAKDSNWHVENTQEAIDDLYNSLGSALVGSVYSYMGTSAPFGYLACDGSVYNIEDYPRLANHINRSFGSYNYFGGDGTTTFAVPDLRGEFLRGTGTNSHTNQGSGTTVGTHQDATNFTNIRAGGSNELWFDKNSGENVTKSLFTNFDSEHTYVSHVRRSYYNRSGTDTNFNGNIYGTSRPTNTSVLYIIKY